MLDLYNFELKSKPWRHYIEGVSPLNIRLIEIDSVIKLLDILASP